MSDEKPDTLEQRARDLLERAGVTAAQSFSAGDVVEIANLLAVVEVAKRFTQADVNLLRLHDCDEDHRVPSDAMAMDNLARRIASVVELLQRGPHE